MVSLAKQLPPSVVSSSRLAIRLQPRQALITSRASPRSYSSGAHQQQGTASNQRFTTGRILLLGGSASLTYALLANDRSSLLLEDASLAVAHTSKVVEEDESYKPHRPLRSHSLSTLINTYVVYSICSFSSLVNVGPALIDWSSSTSLPFVWPINEWIIRRTFFQCFVSDDSAEGSLPVLSSLSRGGLGSLLVYSVEVTKDGAQAGNKGTQPTTAVHRPFIDELLHSVDMAAKLASMPADYGATDKAEAAELAARPDRSGSTFVAIKLSGLLYDTSVLERASAAIVPREWFSSPPEPAPPLAINGSGPCGGLAIPVAALEPKDVQALKELWQVLREVTLRAKQHGNVRLAIDAEYSWYQPAIDAMYEAIAAEFNRPLTTTGVVNGPLVYNTFQAYLRRTPSHLAASLERARMNGYTLGVKLVRGAYMDIENATWSNKSVDTPPIPKASKARAPEYEGWRSPIWPTKDLTDRCFNGCAIRLAEEIQRDIDAGKKKSGHPKLAVIFASHNTQSALQVTRRMVELGMAKPDPALVAAAKESGEKVPLVNLQLEDGVRGRVFFAQLYGMASALTARMQAAFDPMSGGTGPHVVLKYVPYGPLKLVMPYLIRRAVENGSVMSGGAAREKELVQTELLYRMHLKK